MLASHLVLVPRPTLEVLERTRRGEDIDPADVAALIGAWDTGAASDAQMSAWCATAGLRGIPYEGALAMARALLAGGDRLELGRFGPTGDPRSAGGVGDSALVITAAAIAAALGVKVASTGARSLAHVGGVLDALDAIPGMQSRMTVEDYVRQVRDVGIAIAEPGERLVPGERRLAILRESTATAEGDVLVAVATAVRAISGGASVIALEVPGGCGGLLADAGHAAAVCTVVQRLGAEWNRAVHAQAVVRAEPLAGAAGHALEVAAAAAVLRGEGDPAVARRACEMAEALAVACGVLDSPDGAAASALADGRALAAAERWVEAQGGEPEVWTDPSLLRSANITREVCALVAGVVTGVDAGVVGTTARWLGAGRLDPGQVIDSAVGVQVLARPGVTVSSGEPLAIIHSSDPWLADRAQQMLGAAWDIAGDDVVLIPVVGSADA